MNISCHSCGRSIEVNAPLGRRDLCPGCEAELRCCFQCRLYEANSSTDCREPQAEAQRDKDRANFCEFFEPGSPVASGAAGKAEQAKSAFDALFRK